MIYLPRHNLLWQRRFKPRPGEARINWGHPLAGGIKLLLPLWENVGEPLDLITDIEYARDTSAVTWTAREKGTCLDFDGTAKNRLEGSGGANISGTAGTTFIYVQNIDVLPAGGIRFFSHRWSVYIAALKDTVTDSAQIHGQSVNGVGVSDFVNSGEWVFVWSSNGSAAGKKFFANGEDRGTADANAPTSISTGAKQLDFFGYAGASAYELDGRVYYIGWTSAIWGQSEAYLLYSDPFCFFTPIKHRRVFIVSATGETSQPAAATASATAPDPQANITTTPPPAAASATLAEPQVNIRTEPHTATATASAAEPKTNITTTPPAAIATATSAEPQVNISSLPSSASASSAVADPKVNVSGIPAAAQGTANIGAFSAGAPGEEVATPAAASASAVVADPAISVVVVLDGVAAAASAAEPKTNITTTPPAASASASAVEPSMGITSYPPAAAATATPSDPQANITAIPMAAVAVANGGDFIISVGVIPPPAIATATAAQATGVSFVILGVEVHDVVRFPFDVDDTVRFPFDVSDVVRFPFEVGDLLQVLKEE